MSSQRRLLLLHNLTSQHREVSRDGGLVVGGRPYLAYSPAVSSSSCSQGEEERDRLPLVLREPFRFDLQDDFCGELLPHWFPVERSTMMMDVCMCM